MNSALTALIVCLFLLFSGCAVVPVPLFGHTGKYKAIDDGSVKFIEVGKTRKEDVLLQLGAPDWFNKDTFGYNIEKYRGGLLWFYGSQYGGDAGAHIRTTRWSLLIKFDTNSVVKAYRFIDEWNETQIFGCNLCKR